MMLIKRTISGGVPAGETKTIDLNFGKALVSNVIVFL